VWGVSGKALGLEADEIAASGVLVQFAALNGASLYEADRDKRKHTGGQGLTGDEIASISFHNLAFLVAVSIGQRIARPFLANLELQGKLQGQLLAAREAGARVEALARQVVGERLVALVRLRRILALDSLRNGKPGVIRPESGLSNADVADSMNAQLQNVKSGQVNEMLGKFPDGQREHARQVLARASGFGRMESLNPLRDALQPHLDAGKKLNSPAEALGDALGACGRIDGIWSDNALVDERATDQPAAAEFVAARRARGWTGLYFGGVAFKYQREVAGDALGRATALAMSYMDVACTSGPGTGKAADVDKVIAMRQAIGPEGAIALASGVTAENVGTYLPYVDAFLVGTGIEARFGVLDPCKLAALLAAVKG
jgi:hypothetical protein